VAHHRFTAYETARSLGLTPALRGALALLAAAPGPGARRMAHAFDAAASTWRCQPVWWFRAHTDRSATGTRLVVEAARIELPCTRTPRRSSAGRARDAWPSWHLLSVRDHGGPPWP